jgi:hypothetical protein
VYTITFINVYLLDSGEWDSVGTVLKTKIRMEQLRHPDQRF